MINYFGGILFSIAIFIICSLIIYSTITDWMEEKKLEKNLKENKS